MLIYLVVGVVAWFVAHKTVQWKTSGFGAFLGFVFGTSAAVALSWVVVMVLMSNQDAVLGPDLAERLRMTAFINLAKFAPVMAGTFAYTSLRSSRRKK